MKTILPRGISIITTRLSNMPSIILLLAAFCFIQQNMYAQDGELLYKQTCAACHSIGKGKLVGPDLHSVTSKRNEAWLLKWIKSSQSLINSGDADAKAVFEANNKIPMPDQNLSEPDIKAIITYIKDRSSQVPAQSEIASSQPAGNNSDNASAEEVTTGQKIFDGSIRLTNGGAACISCHNVISDRIMPGGLLAKDLTAAHSRLGGDAGIMGILNAPPFPAMTQAYRGKAITEKEIASLTAFLNKAEKESVTQKAVMHPLLKWGFIGWLAWVVVIFFIWYNRKKDTVKLQIFKRQVKSF